MSSHHNAPQYLMHLKKKLLHSVGIKIKENFMELVKKKKSPQSINASLFLAK